MELNGTETTTPTEKMTTRADIMKVENKEEAFALINAMDWTEKRKTGERAYWKRKWAPETINRNPAKGNRGGKVNLATHDTIADMTVEEFTKLKEGRKEKYQEKKAELEKSIKRHEEVLVKLRQELEHVNKKL